jgi:hypothetical protein
MRAPKRVRAFPASAFANAGIVPQPDGPNISALPTKTESTK